MNVRSEWKALPLILALAGSEGCDCKQHNPFEPAPKRPSIRPREGFGWCAGRANGGI